MSTCRSSASPAGSTARTTRSTCRLSRKVRQVFRCPDSLLPPHVSQVPSPSPYKGLSSESSRLCEVTWFPYLAKEGSEASGRRVTQQAETRCVWMTSGAVTVYRGSPQQGVREGFLEEETTARNPLFILGLLQLICPLNSMLLKGQTDCASATPLLQETHQRLAHSKCL